MQWTKPRSQLYIAFLGVLLALQGCASHTGRASSASAATTQAIAAQATHPRLLPLEGGQNFRDLGGYAGAKGKTVRWDVLFRSGSMHGLTPTDFTYLEGLGLRTVVDLRTPQERTREPVSWPAAHAPTVLSEDYTLDSGALAKVLGKPNATAEEARVAMAALYEVVPFQLASQYRHMFERLLAGDAPLVMNCSAGKDRTGVGSALLLTALGVSRETVVQDYLLSNLYVQPSRLAMTTRAPGSSAPSANERTLSALQARPPGVMQAVVGVDRSYIDAAFAAIEKQPGGLDKYFREQLGLSKRDTAALRARYLQ